ncbi:MAG TPA: DSD1 family PLP-dependent enzyme [Vicinamibacterales bacterium]|jgi:D-serine deaminase-like pyridoxal phosphate-dependent protein
MRLDQLSTPLLVLDRPRMLRNIERMRSRLGRLGVGFRPHVKTNKCIEVSRLLMPFAHGPITVSTLKEAEQFFSHGVTDILYAVGIAPGKLAHVADLRARGCDLAVILDSRDAARAVSAFCAESGCEIPALIEIDADDHRGGVKPDEPALLDVAGSLTGGASVRGVMTHAGASYACRSVAALAAMAEQERAAVVRAAERLRAAGFPAPIVSVGSTPTATFAEDLSGVTEVRAGVFVFQDLVMAGLGVCAVDDIALSVLVSVIGHQREKGWIITDGGWLAVSRDRGTASQPVDQGYGLVLDLDGRRCDGLVMNDANQEHGIISRRDGGPIDWPRFPIGALLRVLPNHACATAAQHAAYHVIDGSPEVSETWERFGGW